MNGTQQKWDYLPLPEVEGCKFLPHQLNCSLQDHIRRVRNLAWTENGNSYCEDVLVVGWPKSGYSSLWPLLRSLLKHRGSNNQAPSFQTLDSGDIDELSYRAPRVLHTSYPLRFLPSQTPTQRPRVIFLLRNPKDLCVSMYKQLKGAWSYMGFRGSMEDFLHGFLGNEGEYGGWFNYVLQYLQDLKEHNTIPVHVIHYEDMVQNPYDEARSLCSFLGVDIDDGSLQELVDNCLNETEHPSKRLRSDNDVGLAQDTFYCKGEVGDWRNWLTVAQDEMFDDVIAQQLTGSGLTFKFS